MRRAVFFDKDGTLVENIPHNVSPEHIRLSAGARGAVYRLRRAGFWVIVVSNQPGVADGLFHEPELGSVSGQLKSLLGRFPAMRFRAFYCPHRATGRVDPYARHCLCRKPQPGLLIRAARRLRLSLPDSWMVGDILDDIEAGRRAHCRTILLDNGGETEWRRGRHRTPDHIVRTLREVPGAILRPRGGAGRQSRP
ncbi:MAG: D-glycero-alpha-D-manno-heptose-1,7-bisphosphate 7-phosphatase [Acidiferrobacteraceae bacterium]